eukprot:2871070-Prymnesium_polylepis.1
MTEFGGEYFTPDPTKPQSIETLEEVWLLDEADARLQSWTFWDLSHFYDYPTAVPGCKNHDAECRSLKFMSRPYAQAVAGTPLAMHLDSATGVFTLRFSPDAAIQAPTEIFLPPHRYPEGFQ